MHITHLNSKEINLFFEICCNKKTNRLNEDIFKKLKQSTSRVAKSLTRKFDEIKHVLKNPKTWRRFLSWLKINKNKINNIILITTMSTNIIACNTSGNKYHELLAQQRIEQEQKEEDALNARIAEEALGKPSLPGEIIVITYTSENGPDGEPIIKNLKKIDTSDFPNTDTGDLGVVDTKKYALSQRGGYGSPHFSLARVSNQFGNILDNIQGIFFYNKIVENSLVDLLEKIKVDFGKNSLKSKQYTKSLRLQNKEYKAFYMIYNTWSDKDKNPAELQKFVNSWKSSILQRNPTAEDVANIEKVAKKIYECGIKYKEERVGGFVCTSEHDTMIKSYNHVLPTIIKFKEREGSSKSIGDTLRHETGHMIFDNDYISDIINYIVTNHGGSTVTKQQLQSIILEKMSLSINKEEIESRTIKIKDLPASITAKIKNTVKSVCGLMLASGEIKIKKNNKITINAQADVYMSRHNEFIQHTNDRIRGLNRLLKKLNIENKPKKIILLMKIIIDGSLWGGNVDGMLSYRIEDFLRNFEYYKKIPEMKMPSDLKKKEKSLTIEIMRKIHTKLTREDLQNNWREIVSEYNKVYKTHLDKQQKKDLLDSIIIINNRENLKELTEWTEGLSQLAAGHYTAITKQRKFEIKGFVSLILELENYISLNISNKKAGDAGLDQVNEDLTINSELFELIIKEQKIDSAFVDEFMSSTVEQQEEIKYRLSVQQKKQFNKIYKEEAGDTSDYFNINESVQAFYKIKKAVLYKILNESYV